MPCCDLIGKCAALLSGVSTPPPSARAVRWKPGVRIALLGIATIIGVQFYEEWPFQRRNLISYEIGFVICLALLVWGRNC